MLCVCLGVTIAAIASAEPPAVYDCTSFRLKDSCKPSLDTRRVEQGLKGEQPTITTTVTLPGVVLEPENACLAAVSISYAQMYDKIRVDAIVENEDCASSAGEYVIRARTVSDAGEAETREFVETWAREDAVTVEQRHEYPMDGNATLSWVTVKTRAKSACSCIEP